MNAERWNYLKNLKPGFGYFIHISSYITTNFLGQRVVVKPGNTYRKAQTGGPTP